MRPNHVQMARARAEVDENINKVLTLVAQPEGEPIDLDQRELQIVTPYLDKARSALRRFEQAVRGGAS